MIKKRFPLILIFLLFIFLVMLDLPTIPIHINIGKLKINRNISHISVNSNIAGTAVNIPLKTVLGLDLKGGTEIVLQADMSKISQSDRQNVLLGAQKIIENRINLYGVAEPNVYTEVTGNIYKIVVDIAGVTNLYNAEQVLGQTASMSFDVLSPTFKGSTPTMNDLVSTGLTGSDITGAQVIYTQSSASPGVQLLFSSQGLTKFSQIAKENVNKPVYILLDNQVISSPVISQSLAGGVVNNPYIQGNFTVSQAKDLVTQLDAGALPVPISIIQVNNVSASLGATSLKQSLIAGIVGIFIVFIFMIYFYRIFGFFADLALIIYTLLVFSIFKIIPVTLTLAGIAGFILSIGMAVDANILIFERLKEELRQGKEIKSAIENGFNRAWPSIRDSNISSLITTAILYSFGTSEIKGFALTLGIGVIVSMFTAVVITRTLLKHLFENRVFTKGRLIKIY